MKAGTPWRKIPHEVPPAVPCGTSKVAETVGGVDEPPHPETRLEAVRVGEEIPAQDDRGELTPR